MTNTGSRLTRDPALLDPFDPFCYLNGPSFTAESGRYGPARRSLMTKQRRPSKPTRAKALASSDESRPPHPPPQQSAPPSVVSAAPPARRSTYVEAVALYERGLDALQRHDYVRSAELLESVLRQYPEEKELHERVRLYLNICQRQAT